MFFFSYGYVTFPETLHLSYLGILIFCVSLIVPVVALDPCGHYKNLIGYLRWWYSGEHSCLPKI